MIDDHLKLWNIRGSKYITESKELCSGIFWVITENSDFDEWKLLPFDIPCDTEGIATETPLIRQNSKNGLTYNHKKIWESEVQNNSVHKPYNKKAYDYYPRGRVEISHDRATIYLNPHIGVPVIVDEIKRKFGLNRHNVSEVQVSADGSVHYRCFIDEENK